MHSWLNHTAPKFASFGLLWLVRDVLSVSGFVELHKADSIQRIVLNRNSELALGYANAFRRLLKLQRPGVGLGSTWRRACGLNT